MKLNSVWVKLAIFVVVLILLFVVFRALGIDVKSFTPESIRERLLSFGIWAPVVYMLFYTFRPFILPIFPASLLTVSSGFTFGPLFGTIYTVIGGTGCAVVEFLFARTFGRGAVAKLMKGNVAKIDEKIEQHGFMTVLWIRLIPNVAYDIQNYSLGLTKVRFRDFFLATFFGIMPGTFAYVFFGFSLGDKDKLLKLLPIALIIIIGLILLQRFFSKRQSQKA